MSDMPREELQRIARINRKEYLGDGVYVEIEGGIIKLTTSDGLEDTNTIFLEAEVWIALHEYMERLKP